MNLNLYQTEIVEEITKNPKMDPLSNWLHRTDILTEDFNANTKSLSTNRFKRWKTLYAPVMRTIIPDLKGKAFRRLMLAWERSKRALAQKWTFRQRDYTGTPKSI